MAVMDKKKPKDRHKHKIMAIRLPPAYRTQMELLARKTRRTLTEEAKIAFENHLAQHDLWPPPDAE